MATGAHSLRCRCSQSQGETSRPPARAATEIGSSRAKGAGAHRSGPKLPLGRTGTWFEQEHRGSHRQTKPGNKRPCQLIPATFPLCGPVTAKLCDLAMAAGGSARTLKTVARCGCNWLPVYDCQTLTGANGGRPRIKSEARSASIMTIALICAEGMSGSAAASTTRRRSMP